MGGEAVAALGTDSNATPQMPAPLPTPPHEPERPADDILIGAPAIAAFLGVSKKRLYYYVSKKRLPVGKFGKNLIASKAKLRRAIRDLV